MHDLCIVIAAERCEDRLGPALCSLLERAGWLDLEVIVADTGSGEVAQYIEENFIDVRTIHCPNRGVAHAANRALESANARYLLFVDPGLELCEGSLSTLVARLDARPEVGLAGVRRVRSNGSTAPGMRRYPLDWTSGFILVRRSALAASGWFDERFFAFGEKADLCVRLQRKGWQLIHTGRLTVRSRRSRQRDPRLEAHAAHARMQFACKHFPLAAADYRWALAGRYAMRLGLSWLLPCYGSDSRQAARAALATVFRGGVPLEESSAL
jgi:GT2 family glycosyltransferase